MRLSISAWFVLALFSVAGLAQEHPIQPAAPPPDAPVFHAEARQVLVGASVWKKDSQADPALRNDLKQTLKGLPSYVQNSLAEILREPARGLSAGDFHVFDNDAEQNLNYFREFDFPSENMSNEWWFEPTMHGVWGIPPAKYAVAYARAFYLMGYAPRALAAGECHQLRAAVQNDDVDLTRNRYCNGGKDEIGNSVQEGTTVGMRMREFASSSKPGSIELSMQAFAFRSSAALNLSQQRLLASNHAADEAAPGFTFVVNVNDSKPTRLHLVAHFALHKKIVWKSTKGGWDLPLYVLALIYDREGNLVGQFGEKYPYLPTRGNAHSVHAWDPARYDTQVELLPGEYELRLVVGDGDSYFGRAQMPLQVKPFRADRLSISDIVLSDIVRPASELLRDVTFISPASLVPTPLISNEVQILPVADNRFAKRNPLAVYFEVYEPLLEKEAPNVSVQLKVTDLKSGATKTIGPESAAKWITPGNPVIPIAMTIAGNSLSKGTYRVQVQASDSAGRQTEWQHADFSVK